MVGHTATRSRGTVGGSAAHADPCAELPVALVALDARFRLVSVRGEREVRAGDFFRGSYRTALAVDELLSEIVVPAVPDGARTAFVEQAPTHGDFAVAGVAALTVPDEYAAIALLGAGPAPSRAVAAEQALIAGADVASVAASRCPWRRGSLPASAHRRARPARARGDRGVRITVEINGAQHGGEVEPRTLLSDFIRHQAGLTGTHVGCEHGACGSCTVQLDGEPVRSCLMLAVQADGRQVRTVEGLAAPGEELTVLQRSFREHHALQCGFCTAGFLMTAEAFLRRRPNPTEREIREELAGNLCRCTGYEGIVAAVLAAAGPPPQPG